MPSTERLVVLLTPEQKTAIAARAKAQNLTMGEVVRRSVESYRPSEDDVALEKLLEQVEASTTQANHALDDALEAIKSSLRRIDACSAAAQKRTRRAKKTA
jgi:hypothetical protein